MNVKIVTGVIVVVLIAGILVFIFSSNSNNQIPTGQTTQNAPVKFSESSDYKYAYLISGSNLSTDAEQALAGFNLSITLNPDNTTTYTLTALKQGYQNQTYTLKPGENLYFIERSFGDDNVADNSDYNLNDDYALIVNSDGYIVQ